MGMQAPDWAVMPVCRGCHTEIHNNPKLWPEQWEAIVRTLGKYIDEHGMA
jgi:hypothetical protein